MNRYLYLAMMSLPLAITAGVGCASLRSAEAKVEAAADASVGKVNFADDSGEHGEMFVCARLNPQKPNELTCVDFERFMLKLQSNKAEDHSL